MKSARRWAASWVLWAGLAGADVARADEPPDPPKKGGCSAEGVVPWSLPPLGLGIVFLVRHRVRTLRRQR